MVFLVLLLFGFALSLARSFSFSLSLIRGSSSGGGDDCVDDGFLRFLLVVAMVTDVTMIAAGGDRQGLLR